MSFILTYSRVYFVYFVYSRVIFGKLAVTKNSSHFPKTLVFATLEDEIFWCLSYEGKLRRSSNKKENFKRTIVRGRAQSCREARRNQMGRENVGPRELSTDGPPRSPNS